MAFAFAKISTTVRNLSILYAARIGFLIGGWLLPETTLVRAARIFSTPFRSSRARAASASTAGAREERLTVDGIEIATYLWGDATQQPYVLFAHGWSSHGTRIAPWIEPLQAAGYAVVAFDQAGHGKSGGHRTTLPDFACHLLAVGQHYGPAAAVLGHSLGGAAAAVALARGLAAERAILIAEQLTPSQTSQQIHPMNRQAVRADLYGKAFALQQLISEYGWEIVPPDIFDSLEATGSYVFITS